MIFFRYYFFLISFLFFLPLVDSINLLKFSKTITNLAGELTPTLLKYHFLITGYFFSFIFNGVLPGN